MAKKAATKKKATKTRSKAGFNMAEEVRNLLKKNPKLTGPEVFAALKKKFPRQKINENSCGVAFSGARKKLGIKSGRRRKKGAKRTVVKRRPAAVKVDDLQAAAKFLSEVGDADKAIAAIKQVQALQVK